MITFDIPYEYMNGHLIANQIGQLNWSKEKLNRFNELKNKTWDKITAEEIEELDNMKDEFYNLSNIRILDYEIEDCGELLFQEGVIEYIEN